MRGCEWAVLSQSADVLTQELSSFLFQKSISSDDILTAVQAGQFYGMLKVDVETPGNVIEQYSHLNFPLIFKNVEVTLDMLSPEMQLEVLERKKKMPATYKTLCWNATGIVLASPMIQFYQKIGIKVHNVEWAVEDYESKPFTKFVNKLVDVRNKVQNKKKIILKLYFHD